MPVLNTWTMCILLIQMGKNIYPAMYIRLYHRVKHKRCENDQCTENPCSNLIHPFNPFPNKPWFLHVGSTGLSKTLWEEEKLLVTSNFSFSHSVFYLSGELSAIFIKFENCCLQTLSV